MKETLVELLAELPYQSVAFMKNPSFFFAHHLGEQILEDFEPSQISDFSSID